MRVFYMNILFKNIRCIGKESTVLQVKMRVFFLCVALLLRSASSQTYNLVWSDEFDGDAINLDNWQHEITAWGGGNGEFEVYTNDPTNSYVQNGMLYIKPSPLANNTNPQTGQPFGEDFLENGELDLVAMYGACTMSENYGCYRVGGDIPHTMSARIRSYQRFSFKYGKVEVRAKMPVADWTWPAIWLLPEDYVYGAWPRSGEMDMVECIGNEDFKVNDAYEGIQQMGSTLHWGPNGGENRYYMTADDRTNVQNDYGNNFHNYSMFWDENAVRFYIDGDNLLTVPNPPIDQNPDWSGFYDYGAPWNNPDDNPWEGGTLMAPFDQNFHFIMNVAVGGTSGYMPDGGVNRGGDPYNKPWVNFVSQMEGSKSFWDARQYWDPFWVAEGDNRAMQVDYIRVYQQA